MYPDINVEKILFIDIETVSQYADYDDLDEQTKTLWDHKATVLMQHDAHKENYCPPPDQWQ